MYVNFGAKRSGAATLLVGGDENDCKAIIAFDADGLDCRSADARLGGYQFVESPHALDIGISAIGVDDGALPHDIVDDDQAAASRQF